MVFGLHGFVGQPHDFGLQQGLGEGFVRRQVQVGEQQQAGLEVPVFALQRLLDFDDHVGLFPDRRHGQDAPAGGRIGCIVNTAAQARAGFHQYGMSAVSQSFDARGRKPHAVFIRLDFLGNADNHGKTPCSGWWWAGLPGMARPLAAWPVCGK